METENQRIKHPYPIPDGINAEPIRPGSPGCLCARCPLYAATNTAIEY